MAGEFLTGLGAGAVVGAGIREIIKALGGGFVKRHFDKAADKRKLVRDDSAKLAESAESLVGLALKYYGKPSIEVAAEADQIRNGFKTFGVRWNTVDNRLRELGLPTLEAQHLIRFRQALTSQLHVDRALALSIDSTEVASVFSAFSGISEALSSLKYSAV